MLTVIKSTDEIWFTDNVVVHMIKRTGIFDTVGETWIFECLFIIVIIVVVIIL